MSIKELNRLLKTTGGKDTFSKMPPSPSLRKRDIYRERFTNSSSDVLETKTYTNKNKYKETIASLENLNGTLSSGKDDRLPLDILEKNISSLKESTAQIAPRNDDIAFVHRVTSSLSDFNDKRFELKTVSSGYPNLGKPKSPLDTSSKYADSSTNKDRRVSFDEGWKHSRSSRESPPRTGDSDFLQRINGYNEDTITEKDNSANSSIGNTRNNSKGRANIKEMGIDPKNWVTSDIEKLKRHTEFLEPAGNKDFLYRVNKSLVELTRNRIPVEEEARGTSDHQQRGKNPDKSKRNILETGEKSFGGKGKEQSATSKIGTAFLTRLNNKDFLQNVDSSLDDLHTRRASQNDLGDHTGKGNPNRNDLTKLNEHKSSSLDRGQIEIRRHHLKKKTEDNILSVKESTAFLDPDNNKTFLNDVHRSFGDHVGGIEMPEEKVGSTEMSVSEMRASLTNAAMSTDLPTLFRRTSYFEPVAHLDWVEKVVDEIPGMKRKEDEHFINIVNLEFPDE